MKKVYVPPEVKRTSLQCQDSIANSSASSETKWNGIQENFVGSFNITGRVEAYEEFLKQK